jgi:hypothetical protein
VLRRGKERCGRAASIDHLAGIHHGHRCAISHHAHVVRDQHQRHAAVFLQAAQQVENLRLDGDIQRRGGFVGNQQLGVAGNGHGDHHALAHAARQSGAGNVQRRLSAPECPPAPAVRWSARARRLVHAQVQLQRFQPAGSPP